MANHDGTMEYVNDYTTCIHILQQLMFILVVYTLSS